MEDTRFDALTRAGPECFAPPANGTTTCTSETCGFACATGYHPCGDTCASNDDVATCGTSCTPCPVPDHGTATWDGTSCGISCDTGYTLCDEACVDEQTDLNHCGGCDTVCDTGQICQDRTCVCAGTVIHDICTATCASGFTCGGGTTSCGGTCVCLSTAEGGAGCVNVSGATCETFQPCSVTTDCSAGFACIVNTCCPGEDGICVRLCPLAG